MRTLLLAILLATDGGTLTMTPPKAPPETPHPVIGWFGKPHKQPPRLTNFAVQMCMPTRPDVTVCCSAFTCSKDMAVNTSSDPYHRVQLGVAEHPSGGMFCWFSECREWSTDGGTP